MMQSRVGRIIRVILSILILAAGAVLGAFCIRSGQVVHGIVVLLSFSVMAVCMAFLAVKSILDAEQAAYRDHGEERGRVPCRCEYRDFSGDGGELVFYERGMAYEQSGNEPLGIFPYGKFSHAVQDGDAVMVFVAHSLKARVMTVEARSALKARAIMNLLDANGIELR